MSFPDLPGFFSRDSSPKYLPPHWQIAAGAWGRPCSLEGGWRERESEARAKRGVTRV
jgi:hypothetical protein